MGTKTSQSMTQQFLDLYAEPRAGALARESAQAKLLRDDAIKQFAQAGMPDRHMEAWKYTSLAPIAAMPLTMDNSVRSIELAEVEPFFFNAGAGVRLVFVNGLYSESLSNLPSMQSGVLVEPWGLGTATTSADLDAGVIERCAEQLPLPLAPLNTALTSGGASIRIAPDTQCVDAIQLLFLATADATAAVSFPRVSVVVGRAAAATVVENHIALDGAPTLALPVTQIHAQVGSHVDHVRTVELSAGAVHLGAVAILQEPGSRVESCVVTSGGLLARHDFRVSLDGEGADCNIRGLAMLDGASHVDHHLLVRHAAPSCTSREFFKNVLDDSSRGVFTGRIYVDIDAQKTDGVQTNATLLLSDDAKTEARPQLEIYADDVKCTHGATIGQIDENAIFYLQARGVPEELARTMLIQGFADEILDEIRIEELRDRLKANRFVCATPPRSLQPSA